MGRQAGHSAERVARPREPSDPVTPPGLVLSLGPVAGSSPRARAALRQTVLPSAFAGRLDDAELALSELVTNAVLHARMAFEVRIDVGAQALRVSVDDQCPIGPSFSMLDPTAVTGRGLLLVSAVADRWGVDPLPQGGKRVWFEMLVDAAPEDVDVDVDALLAAWGDDLDTDPASEQVRVVLTDLSTELTARSEAHVEGLLRELALVSGAQHVEEQAELTAHRVLAAASATDAVRADLRHQLSLALAAGLVHVDITLVLRRDAAGPVQDLTAALLAADRMSRTGALLMAPAPAELTEARSGYLRRILAQLTC